MNSASSETHEQPEEALHLPAEVYFFKWSEAVNSSVREGREAVLQPVQRKVCHDWRYEGFLTCNIHGFYV